MSKFALGLITAALSFMAVDQVVALYLFAHGGNFFVVATGMLSRALYSLWFGAYTIGKLDTDGIR